MVEQTAMGYPTNKIDHLENRKSPWKGDNKKRLTLGPDFILSHSISGTARLPYGQPGSPGFTSRSEIIIAQSGRLQQLNRKSGSPSGNSSSPRYHLHALQPLKCSYWIHRVMVWVRAVTRIRLSATCLILKQSF